MNFFENIGKFLFDMWQTAAKKTKNFFKINRLNSEISKNEKEMFQLFAQIGQTYYNKYKEDGNVEGAEEIAKISALNYDIYQKRESIKQLKGVTNCENCGAEISIDCTFCNTCGFKIETAVAMDTNDMNSANMCPICHKATSKDNSYCVFCGAKLENNDN